MRADRGTRCASIDPALGKSSEVLSNCPAREGSAEYIGIKQPVAPESISRPLLLIKFDASQLSSLNCRGRFKIAL